MDEQEIRQICFEPEGWHYEVGNRGVEKITTQKLPDQGGFVLWFVVWKNGKIARRCNARYVAEVLYKEGADVPAV